MTPGTAQRKLALIILHDGTETVGYRALAQLDEPLIIELLEKPVRLPVSWRPK